MFADTATKDTKNNMATSRTDTNHSWVVVDTFHAEGLRTNTRLRFQKGFLRTHNIQRYTAEIIEASCKSTDERIALAQSKIEQLELTDAESSVTIDQNGRAYLYIKGWKKISGYKNTRCARKALNSPYAESVTDVEQIDVRLNTTSLSLNDKIAVAS